MMREEFEGIIIDKFGGEIGITSEDYAEIEFVYTWHPAIETKNQIADIFLAGGMCVIRDMMETAKMAKDIEDEGVRLRANMNRLNERMKRLEQGDRSYEVLRSELMEAYGSGSDTKQFEARVKALSTVHGEDNVMAARIELCM